MVELIFVEDSDAYKNIAIKNLAVFYKAGEEYEIKGITFTLTNGLQMAFTDDDSLTIYSNCIAYGNRNKKISGFCDLIYIVSATIIENDGSD